MCCIWYHLVQAMYAQIGNSKLFQALSLWSCSWGYQCIHELFLVLNDKICFTQIHRIHENIEIVFCRNRGMMKVMLRVTSINHGISLLEACCNNLCSSAWKILILIAYAFTAKSFNIHFIILPLNIDFVMLKRKLSLFTATWIIEC